MAGEIGLSSSGRLTVTSVDVEITDLIPGVAATNLGKAEDAAHTTGDVGVMALAVRADSAAATGANGDYVPLLTDGAGKVWVNVGAVGSGATDLAKLEDSAHSSGDAGVMALAVRAAAATDRSAGATDGDYEPLSVDALGRLWVHQVGHRGVFKINPTVDTSAYGAGDIIGGILTVSNWALSTGGSAILESVTVYDADNEKAGFELIFFDATPSGGTYADQGAPTWHANDAAKCIGRVTVATGDYVTTGGDAIACLRNIMLPLPVAATSLFVLILATATPTYTAGTDLHIALGARY